MEHLIYKYLRGDLTLQEQHELSKWLQSDERNVETLKRINSYWHFHKDSLDEEDKEVRLRLMIKMQEESSKHKGRRRTLYKTLLKIAASVVVVCSLAIGLYKFNLEPQTSKHATEATLVEKVSLPGQRITTVLPDGTKVKLNADSKITVPTKFDGETREITLIGEAFFEVKRDEQHPFIIKTDKIDVKVLGTSFNVQVYDNEEPIIAVKTGKVAVKSIKTEEEINVLPNQMVHLKNEDLIKSSIPDSFKLFAWTDQQLVFNDESPEEVLKKLSRWYGVEIEVQRGITLNKKFTANYDNPTIIEMMDILAFVYDFKYKYYEKEKRIVVQ